MKPEADSYTPTTVSLPVRICNDSTSKFKEESTAEEGASGEGTSSQGGGRMEDLDSESDLDMTDVWPPVPPATRRAPVAEPGAGVGGDAEGNPPTPSVAPGRANFGGINSSSSSSSSDDSRTSSDSSNSNDSGDPPVLVGRPARDLKVSASLPHCKADARGPIRGA